MGRGAGGLSADVEGVRMSRRRKILVADLLCGVGAIMADAAVKPAAGVTEICRLRRDA